MPTQSDPRALPLNHHFVANIFSSFRPPHPTPLPRLKLPSKQRRCQVSSCLSLPPSLPRSPALHTQLGMQALLQAFLPLCGRAGRLSPGGATLPTECKGSDKQMVAVPPAMMGEQLPHCPAASQQAQSNATQNSAVGRAWRNPSL